MKSKSKKKMNFALGILIFILGVAATLMLFLPGLVNGDTDSVYTGSQVVFGTQIYEGALGTTQIEPSVMGIIAYLLPAVAGLLALIIKDKTAAVLSGVMFIAAAVMLFLISTSTVTTVTFLGSTNTYDTTWTMSGGLISAAVISIFGGIVSLYKAAI